MPGKILFRCQGQIFEIPQRPDLIRIDPRKFFAVMPAPRKITEQTAYFRKLPLRQRLRVQIIRPDPGIPDDLALDRASFKFLLTPFSKP